MTETCLGDGVCTNPTCPTHGIEWTSGGAPTAEDLDDQLITEYGKVASK